MKQSTLELAEQHLFSDVDEMTAAGVPAVIQQRLIRLRDMYTRWLEYPRLKDRDIVQQLQKAYGVKKTIAYEDVRIIKRVLGELNKTSKDYHRYRFLQMVDETYDMARRTKDAKALAAVLNYYGKYTHLDKEDEKEAYYDKIKVQPFMATSDPTSIGIKPIPNIREKIQKKIKQYWDEEIEDITYEEADYDEDAIFHLKKKDDEAIPE